MRIGITERGDASIDTSWADKTNTCDGMIIITKNISRFVLEKLLELQARNYQVILHATCTGWGKTAIEPNVPDYVTQLMGINILVASGFRPENIVLRIDPIIPSVTGLKRVRNVLEKAVEIGLDLNKIRVRISVIDEYRHVKSRLQAMGLNQIYPGTQFYASPENFQYVACQLRQIRDDVNPGMKFYCCAEPNLTDPDLFVHAGCISQQDLAIMGLEYNQTSVNPQNRGGCLCLSVKHELLNQRHRCPHQCVYCYWKD